MKNAAFGVVVLLFVVVLSLWVSALVGNTSAQPRAEREPGREVKRWWIDETQDIYVVDTPGVCLYLYSSSTGRGIAAVPKTALKPGVGCS